MMTPIEAMVLAYHAEHRQWAVRQDKMTGRWHVWRTDVSYGDFDDAAVAMSKARDDAAMRAAIIALAGAELPERILSYGAEATAEEPGSVPVEDDVKESFRAVLYALSQET